MAEISTVDLLGYGVVRNLFDIVMTFPAGDSSVNGFVINSRINVVVDLVAVLIDSAEESILMAHETIVLVGSLSLGVNRK